LRLALRATPNTFMLAEIRLHVREPHNEVRRQGERMRLRLHLSMVLGKHAEDQFDATRLTDIGTVLLVRSEIGEREACLLTHLHTGPMPVHGFQHSIHTACAGDCCHVVRSSRTPRALRYAPQLLMAVRVDSLARIAGRGVVVQSRHHECNHVLCDGS